MEMCNMLIDRIFNGNDAVYGLTVQAVDGAIAQSEQIRQWDFRIQPIVCPATMQLPA